MAVFVVSGPDRQWNAERGDRGARPLGGGGRAAPPRHPRHQDRGEDGAARSSFKFGGKVKDKEMAIFTRQFSTMIDAGLPLVQCLNILAEQSESKTLRSVTGQVARHVEAGSTLADALRRHPRTFDDLFTNLVEVGEAGGILDVVLQRLAAYIEKAAALKRKVKAAMVYPVRHHRRRASRRHLHADLRHPDVRPDVQGSGRRAAAAHEDRHAGCRTSCAATSS